jgi:hypothetical protein
MPHASRTLLVVALLLVSRTPLAKPRLQAVGESSLGYTDNAQAARQQEGPTRVRSVFWLLSPGVVVALDTPRQLQRLAYRYEYAFYFNRSASSSSSNRLDYRGLFDLSPRASLVLGGNATQSDRFTSLSFAVPGQSAVGAVPTGTGTFLQAAADQALNLDVAEGYRAWQGASVVWQTPLFETRGPATTGFAGRLGAERTSLADAVGAEARGDYTVVTDGVLLDGTAADTQRQLVGGGVLRWRHDWGRDWTSSAEAGALRLQRLNTHRGLWTPTAAATLAYATERGDAQLAYAHTLSTNALLGQSLLVDDVRLRGALPLTHEGELVIAGTLGYQRGRLLDENAELATKVRVILADVSLGWQATKLLQLGIRYEHIEQRSGATTPPLPLSFVQNNVLAGATVRFPEDREMPRAYRAPRRVDRSDELRDGFQSGVGPRRPGELSR